MNPVTSKVQNLTIPLHLYSNEELRELVKTAIKKEKEHKRGKVIDKKVVLTPTKFLNSKIANKICL